MRCAIAEAFIAACRDEIEAPKPGNVHIYAAGHGMQADDFFRSAEAAAPFLSDPSLSIGQRVECAVAATFAAVGMNTNLGILLLCAPLAAAAVGRGNDLRKNLRQVLAGLTVADAAAAFKAICQAAPAGLGSASRYDVQEPAQVTLREAMHEAAGRDRIACQYATDFGDVFETGVRTLEAARARGWHAPWPATSAYLAFLAAFPDSHIARKHGHKMADCVQKEAAVICERFMTAAHPEDALGLLLDFDRHLKTMGLNPGTSADLTVASIFADKLTPCVLKVAR